LASKVIKFANKETIRDKAKQEITTADRGIIELRATIGRLEKQVQDIEERIAE
jgi:predicted  nucleic acid-binding Zn-ribbon protein